MSLLYFALLVLGTISAIQDFDNNIPRQKVPLMEKKFFSEQVVLRAVRERDATLPCGQGKVFLDGPDSYVIWMKNNNEFLYRYPNEEDSRSSIEVLEQCNGECVDPTSLQIKQVGEQNEGVYRCRVHYQASPAVDYVIELRLVDSTAKPRLMSPDGTPSKGISRLNIGQYQRLICEVEDKEGMIVWWERNGEQVVSVETVQDGVIWASVWIHNASRLDRDARYVCKARNSDVTEPVSLTVVVKMNLPPLSVEIRLNNNTNFEAGVPRVVDCVVVGAVPAPFISWHLGDRTLRSSSHKEVHDGNFTVSSLTLAPSRRDDLKNLTCRVHNSYMTDNIYEDTVVIHVGFRPMSVKDREEVVGYVSGQMESVTCVVDAYPEPKQFSWTFRNTETVYTSFTKIPGYQHRYSSTLTWKPLHPDRGELLCRATNVLGEQKRPCVFSVMFGGPPRTPECEHLSTDLNTIDITCKKYTPTIVSITSGDLLQRVKTEPDARAAASCLALRAAARRAHWDGGRPQTIHLELMYNGYTVLNLSDASGHFNFRKTQQENLTAVLYSSNSRGRSDSTIIFLKLNESHHGKQTSARLIGAAILVSSLSLFLAFVYGSYKFLKYLGFFNTRNGATAQDLPPAPARADGEFERQPRYEPEGNRNRSLNVPLHLTFSGNYYDETPTKIVQVLGCAHETELPDLQRMTDFCV